MTWVPDKPCYTVKEARELLGGITQTTFYKWKKMGKIKTFNIGRRRLVSAAALQKFIHEREQEAT